MYALLSGLVKYMLQKDEYYVLILGLDNAGKTTLLERTKQLYNPGYAGIPMNKITTTVGLNVAKVDIADKNRIIFWDLGGQTSLQSLWNKYYEEAHGVVYVVDSSDPDRIRQSQEAFDQLVGDSNLENVPILVLANKQDRDGCLSVVQVKEVFNQSARRIGPRACKVEPVSAVTGEGIRPAMEWLAQTLVRNSKHRPPKRRDIS
ncbi:GTPase [Capsaspora owczarzaki ATCC 30864]|uniref:GTPase n=1 Tax=Capsaspora owczarzaki (strain ATCC 30864) TaxID=595528 RepID=A0A0D2X4E4_CAPO3|nr:GTPase [Capsaspora owczarzaki ATCC 30864]KJE95914.1 GTPase [Capsaspora owczarzaki ATCC 30864]|eukprot:XP_004345056.1 GTPase [Capsaspora owczarzaki ATCC 30864]